MSEATLFVLQRLSAKVLAPLVIVHLVLILYAVHGGLSAAEILGRTRGSVAWGLFYSLFVITVAIHAPIGVRNIVHEWTRWRGRSLDIASVVLALALLALGFARGGGGGRMRPAAASRRGAGYRAFLAHRISGLVLALFLPLHFLTLGLALEGAEALDRFLAFAELPLVKTAEWGLVVFLAVHLALGTRLLVLEFGPWRGMRTAWLGWTAGVAAAVGLAFLAIA